MTSPALDSEYDPTQALRHLLLRGGKDPDLAHLIKFLLEKGADLSQVEFMAMHTMVVLDRLEVLDVILEHAPTEVLLGHWQELMADSVRGSPSIFNDLLNRGEGDTPRHAAYRSMRTKALSEALRLQQNSCIQKLLDHGLDHPILPLEDSWLAFAKSHTAVELLCQAGAKPTVPALLTAVGLDKGSQINPSMLQAFIEAGSPLHDPQGQPVVWNALMHALQVYGDSRDSYRMALDCARQLLATDAAPKEVFSCNAVQMMVAVEAGFPPEQVAFSYEWSSHPTSHNLPQGHNMEYATPDIRQKRLMECVDRLWKLGVDLDRLGSDCYTLDGEWTRAMARMGVDLGGRAERMGVSPLLIAEGQQKRLDRVSKEVSRPTASRRL